jgi:hypothetical protein
MLFLFDYGDEWRFGVELIGTGERVSSRALALLLQGLPRPYDGRVLGTAADGLKQAFGQ